MEVHHHSQAGKKMNGKPDWLSLAKRRPSYFS